MSRYCEPSVVKVLEAAQKWKERCLLDGKSLLRDDDLWTEANFKQLITHFVENPIEGEAKYYEKLEQQLAQADNAARKLMAEVLWLMFLFPIAKTIRPEKKRDRIARIWKLSGEPLPADHWSLSNAVLAGIGGTGPGFLNHIWREAVYTIRLCDRFVRLRQSDRTKLTSDPWQFAQWLQEVPENDQRQMRHMFLFLLFPDQYERISTKGDKREIIEKLGPGNGIPSVPKDLVELDRQLLSLRKKLEAVHKTTNLDFYLPPIAEAWKGKEIGDPKDPEDTTEYWLAGAYWDGDDMTGAFVNEGRWENGHEDKLLEEVKEVQIGDRIAIKSLFTRKSGLPFDAGGRAVSCMRIRARGRVTGNPGDGRNLNVDWEKDFTPFEVYRRPYWGTLERIDKAKDSEVIQWVFLGKKQPLAAGEPLAAQEEIPGGTPTNLILVGPPGTGKTYRVLEELLPAYSERTAEPTALTEQALSEIGWLPVIVAALKDLVGSAKVGDLLEHRLIRGKAAQLGRTKNVANTLWNYLQSHTVESSKTVKIGQRHPPLVFDKAANAKWELVDGWEGDAPDLAQTVSGLLTKKKGIGTVKRYELVTFHPSYSYEDFVEGIRPVVDEESGALSYEVVDGTFKALCNRAAADSQRRYAIFIDEINRANVAKVFGELITLIEADKRLVLDDKGNVIQGPQVTLPYSKSLFGIPSNVDLYGTMNSADRSIALLDVALRRRFRFQELRPNPALIAGEAEGIVTDAEGQPVDLRQILSVLNRRIEVLMDREHVVGHAYFMKIASFDDLKQVFRQEIVPLLQEYFFDDLDSLAKVLHTGTSQEGLAFLVSEQVSLEGMFPTGVASTGKKAGERRSYKLASELTGEMFRRLYKA